MASLLSSTPRMAQFIKFSVRDPGPGGGEGGGGGVGGVGAKEGQGPYYWPSERRLRRRARGLATALCAAGCLSPAGEVEGERERKGASPLEIVGPHLCEDAGAVLGLQGLALSDLRECCSGATATAAAATATHFRLDLR